MSILTKDYNMQYTPGIAGVTGTTGSPAAPGYFYTTTTRHSIFTPIGYNYTAANLRFATHDELRRAGLWPYTMVDCDMQKQILTYMMKQPYYNIPLFWLDVYNCIIMASVPNIKPTFGLYVLTVALAKQVKLPYGVAIENPMYDKTRPYVYHGEIPGCP